MRFLWGAASALLALGQCADTAFTGPRIAPKVMIISLFRAEAEIWYDRMPSGDLGNLRANSVTVPGLSPLFPHVYCPPDYSVCQLTTGEAEINAAASIMALALSDKFNLTKTYFLVAGIAGVNPQQATLGAVALSKYAVQVALQYEFDAREMPQNFSTGYLGFGAMQPDQYPTEAYGTEVFELNEALRDVAYEYASRANLSTNDQATKYGARYGVLGHTYLKAGQAPDVVKCDTATSDVYFTGNLLAEAFESTTKLWTNGSGIYCMTAQEDNAIFEVLVRMHIAGLVDFGRIILMRTASNFDRPPPGVSAFDHLRVANQNGFSIAIENIFLAGFEIVKGILSEWCDFEAGIKTTNYIGDILGSLGGEPDFGLRSLTGGQPVKADDGRDSGALAVTTNGGKRSRGRSRR